MEKLIEAPWVDKINPNSFIPYSSVTAKFRKVKQTDYGISKTIPDDSLTMRQLIDRYARGLEIEGKRESFFDEEGEEAQGIDIRKLDLTELDDLKKHYEAKIKDYREQQSKAKNEKEYKRIEAKILEQQKLMAPESNNIKQKDKTIKNPIPGSGITGNEEEFR